MRTDPLHTALRVVVAVMWCASSATATFAAGNGTSGGSNPNGDEPGTTATAPGGSTAAAGSTNSAGGTAHATGAGSTNGSGAAAGSPSSGADSPARPAVHHGNAFAFRNLIPSPVLEQVTAEQYHRIVQADAQAGKLLPDGNAGVQRLRALIERLAPYAIKWNERVKGWHWEVNVVRSHDIQILCLPGGKILVDSALLDRLHLNENELGVLLAHEIAHALREHARASLGDIPVSSSGLGTTPMTSLYGLSEPLPAPPAIGERIATLHYSATDETEADVIGGDIAARAGIDPRAAITLWDKLAAATRADRAHGFIYSHPYSARRRQDLLKRLADLMPVYAKVVGKRIDALPSYSGIPAVRRR